jgi:signal transduction histidine kinase
MSRRQLTQPRPRLRSLKNKLAVLFFGITAAAFSIMFFVVVPQLESNVVDENLADLQRAARASSPQFELAVRREVPAPKIDQLVRNVADASDAVVTLLSAQRSGSGGVQELQPFVISDSRVTSQIDEPLEIAERVFRTGRAQTATPAVRGERVARVARPIELGGETAWVVVYSRQLSGLAGTVDQIRTQVLIATALALLVALVGGYLVARGVARRVRRLETAAEAVAAGDFSGPLPIDSEDELGQLTRTFNEMQRQLARVDRARKEFIATASHELRTPIFSLGGFVELLRDEEIDRDTREEFLAEMGEQVERLKKLSVDLLDLSRLDAGSLELSPERTDVAELARQVAAEFRPRVKDRPERLELELGEGPVPAVCDPGRAAQIMRILLDNALRHTPEGTRVTVVAGRVDGAARFSVADRGPGLDGHTAEHVFDRFYTGDAARGSGLGLAIAKELAELMEGRISVQSGAGRTIFTLELPAAG